MKMPDERIRAYIYAVSVAIFGVLGVYGVIDGDKMGPFLALAAAVCGLATANTSTSKDE